MRSSRQVGAGSRGRVTTDGSPAAHQNSVMSQNSGAPVQRRATQPRPCARADTTRPATANYPPVRKECLSRGFPSKEPPQQFHHTTMICTSNHHSISYYLARTDRPDGRRVTRHLENRFCGPTRPENMFSKGPVKGPRRRGRAYFTIIIISSTVTTTTYSHRHHYHHA